MLVGCRRMPSRPPAAMASAEGLRYARHRTRRTVHLQAEHAYVDGDGVGHDVLTPVRHRPHHDRQPMDNWDWLEGLDLWDLVDFDEQGHVLVEPARSTSRSRGPHACEVGGELRPGEVVPPDRRRPAGSQSRADAAANSAVTR